MNSLSFRIAGLTDRGRTRSNNEDAVWVDPDLGLMIVADGMGGHQAGEVASAMAVATISTKFKEITGAGTPDEVLDERYSPETNRLGRCFRIANQTIFEASKKHSQDGMGTTCTAALITGNRLSVAHVGDSRCYLIRRGEIDQLTQDHSLVMEHVRRGLLSIDDERVRTAQNILTRSLGSQLDVKIDLEELLLQPGDTLLLCSDGLDKEMTNTQILQAISETPEPAELARHLIDFCNAAGGRDNITVSVACIS